MELRHGLECGPTTGRVLTGPHRAPRRPCTARSERHPECVAAVEAMARQCEALGHHVEEARPKIDAHGFAKHFFFVVCADTAAELALAEEVLGRRVKRTDVELNTWLFALAGRALGAGRLVTALARLRRETRKVAAFLGKYDLLLTPTMGRPPARHGELDYRGLELLMQQVAAWLGLGGLMTLDAVVDPAMERAFSYIPFTPVANVSGQPSMSVPLHWSADGLPIGAMFTGRFGDDATLFELAGQLEAARPWANRRPPVHSRPAS